eukprot:COSAG03_NODE_5244_length_1296_cov_583.952460_1_plen_70_part_00
MDSAPFAVLTAAHFVSELPEAQVCVYVCACVCVSVCLCLCVCVSVCLCMCRTLLSPTHFLVQTEKCSWA